MFDCTFVLGAGKEGVIISSRSPTKRVAISRNFCVLTAGEEQQITKAVCSLANYETALEIRHMTDQELDTQKHLTALSGRSGNPYQPIKGHGRVYAWRSPQYVP